MYNKYKYKPKRAMRCFWMIQLHQEHTFTRLRNMHEGIFMFYYN